MTRLALIHAVRAGRVSYEHLRQQGLQGWAPCGAARGRNSFPKSLASRSGHRANRSEDFAPLFLPSDETHRGLPRTPVAAIARGRLTETAMTKPSIVFAHGLWADGSCFSKLIPTLQAEGHEVMASQHGLDSLATDVAAVKACLARVP